MIQIHITFEITIYFLNTIFFNRFDLIELRRKNLPPNKRLSKRKNNFISLLRKYVCQGKMVYITYISLTISNKVKSSKC